MQHANDMDQPSALCQSLVISQSIFLMVWSIPAVISILGNTAGTTSN